MLQTLLIDEFLERSNSGVIVDVRTPAEWEKGHIAGAVNIPLFTNEERAAVGTTYVRVGRSEAIEQGLEFVGPRMADFVRRAKEVSQGLPLFVYCWRGGMRSGSMAWLFSTAGINTFLLKGGYKAYRRSFEEDICKKDWDIVILGGTTGCGKSDILKSMEKMGEQVVDLETLASHKGSVFGGIGQPEQPTNEEFINRIHETLRKFTPSKTLWCEGESISIGKVFIPQLFFDMMRRSRMILVSIPVEARLNRLIKEYGNFDNEIMTESFFKIRKRLGNDECDKAVAALSSGDINTAAAIALNYYDKCYSNSIKTQERALVMNVDFEKDSPDESAMELIRLIREQ